MAQRSHVGVGHHLFQARAPVAAQRTHPVMLLYPLVTVQALPLGLPMAGAGVLPAGQEEDVGGAHLLLFS